MAFQDLLCRLNGRIIIGTARITELLRIIIYKLNWFNSSIFENKKVDEKESLNL